MDYSSTIATLAQNRAVFKNLLENQTAAAYRYRPYPEHWCLLEIVCHLYDEEREDFRQRVRTTLESPGKYPPPIDPQAWVNERAYVQQDYDSKVQAFLEERSTSIKWLKSLKNPQWSNAYEHSELGMVSAHHFLSNWLAHDYLHIRQITRVKYSFLQVMTGESLKYAGDW